MSDRLREERTGEEKGEGEGDAPRLFAIPLMIHALWESPTKTGANSAFRTLSPQRPAGPTALNSVLYPRSASGAACSHSRTSPEKLHPSGWSQELVCISRLLFQSHTHT